MSIAAFMALSLQAASPEGLPAEGERLGRYSTLFALCEPYYAIDIEVGRRLADDFQRRSAEAGWTSSQWSAAYDRGRELERAEVGIYLDTTSVTPREARRVLRAMFPRLKQRCHDLAREAPGAVSDLPAGDRRLDAAAQRVR